MSSKIRKCLECGKQKEIKKHKSFCEECRKISPDKRWKIRNRKEYLKKSREYYHHNREKRSAATILSNKRLRQERRLIVIKHYGGDPPRCSCCSESILEFLTLEHLNGGGRAHRRSLNSIASGIWGWAIKNNFPKGFDVLCMNCNFGKYKNNGTCPHDKN